MKAKLGIALAFLVALAYLAAAHYHWHGLHIDHEVKPVDVLTLLVNVSIAVLLQYVFLMRSSNLRVEKDLNIEDVKSVIVLLRENNEVFLRRLGVGIVLQDWNLCVAQCRSIANAIEFLNVSLDSSTCGKCKCMINQTSTMEEIKNAFFNYKAIVTSDAPRGKVRNGSINDQASAYRKLMRLLRELMSEINRH